MPLRDQLAARSFFTHSASASRSGVGSNWLAVRMDFSETDALGAA